jgi:hypothetical protein
MYARTLSHAASLDPVRLMIPASNGDLSTSREHLGLGCNLMTKNVLSKCCGRVPQI